MPKKQARNSFYYFMIDFKEEQRKKGTVYANMAEVANAAGPAWTSAPPPLRAKYEAIAKAQKQKQNVPEKKFTSTGVSLAEIAQQDAERKDAIEAEREDIQNFVVQKSVNKSIANEDIYLIDVNYYCKTSTHYLIGELTLLRFSLQDGIKNTYHELIYPGTPPVGYALDVKLGCQEYGLEMPDDHSESTNYMQVLANVVDYLKQQDAKMPLPPPVFTMPDKVEPVLDFLQFLCSGTGEDDNQFRVYKLDTLLFMVANAAAGGSDEGFPKESLALVQLKKDSFKYTPNLGCEMHERGELGVQCTSSRVKRWAYTVMDWCCPLLGVEALPGTHVPADFDVDSILTWRETNSREARALSVGAGAAAAAGGAGGADSTLDSTRDLDFTRCSLSSADTSKKEKRTHAPLRLPTTNYSRDFAAPPELSLDSDSEFPSLSSSRGRGRRRRSNDDGRGQAGSYNRMNMQ